MAKTWVLDTQTKGTGATVVPLERKLRKPSPDTTPGFVLPKLKAPEPEIRQPHVFKVVDLLAGEPLVEAVDARAAVHALEEVRSIVDVTVYVWEPATERWRMLTFGETRALWEQRGRL